MWTDDGFVFMKILYSPFFFFILLFLLSRGDKNEKWHSHLFCKFLFIHMIHFFCLPEKSNGKCFIVGVLSVIN